MFAVQEAIIKTCEQSLEAYGLESLSGSAGEVTVNEDVKDICKGYKVGTDIAFIFVHFSNIAGDGFKSLEDGQQVEFEVGPGRKGDEALNVRVI